MPNVVSRSANEGVLYLEASCDLTNPGVVGAVRGTGWTIVRTGAGLYTATYSNPSGEILCEVLNRFADLAGTPNAAFWAKILTVTQPGPAGLQSTPIIVTLTTLNNAATPVATDTTANATLDIGLAIRTIKMVSPI